MARCWRGQRDESPFEAETMRQQAYTTSHDSVPGTQPHQIGPRAVRPRSSCAGHGVTAGFTGSGGENATTMRGLNELLYIMYIIGVGLGRESLRDPEGSEFCVESGPVGR
jgi:hypothetical protein